MKQERLEQISKVFENDTYKIFGTHTDPNVQGTLGVTYEENIEPNSPEAKKLEDLGFKLIYPAELSQSAQERLSEDDRFSYKQSQSHPLIIDSQETPTIGLAKSIAHHYFSSANNNHMLYGYDYKQNSISVHPNEYNFKDGTMENFMQVLNELGFETTSPGKNFGVNIHSNIPYPFVQQSKFQDIFGRAKGKVKETFNKLKSFIKPKEVERNTEGPEL